MKLDILNQKVEFMEYGTSNLIANVNIGNHSNMEVDIRIMPLRNEVKKELIINIIEWVNKDIEAIISKSRVLLSALLHQLNWLDKDIDNYPNLRFEFIGMEINSTDVFNDQFRIVFHLNGGDELPNFDVTGKWNSMFSGSINNWSLSGVNRVG